MDHKDFNRIISETKQRHPFWFELSDENERITENEIEKIEISKGIMFPDQYKRFISKYGAGEFAFTNVYSPLSKGEWSLWGHKSQYRLPDNFIPISDNGCGDYLGFTIQDGKCSEQLYWADHEEGYSIGKSEYSNFYDFILREGLDLGIKKSDIC